LAEKEVLCVGQMIACVIGETYAQCRAAAANVRIEYEELPAHLTIESAEKAQSFIGTPHVMVRGDVDAALQSAPVKISGTITNGGQDHFYLETHAALAQPMENRTFHVISSTQHPSEVQAKVAEVLGLPRSAVVVECPRMGGGFGGKETQAAHFGCL